MKRYEDYPENDVPWTKYKIVVPTQEDKDELMKAFRHLHDAEIDTENIAVNQLIHEYLNGDNIVVNKVIYPKIK